MRVTVAMILIITWHYNSILKTVPLRPDWNMLCNINNTQCIHN